MTFARQPTFAAVLTLTLLTGCTGGADEVAKDDGGLPPTPAEHQSGEATYDANCGSCHDVSREGAPRLGYLRAWEKRIAQGQDTLVAHAIEGKDLMPPKGDNPDLTDEQIAEVVDYMIYRARLDIPAKH